MSDRMQVSATETGMIRLFAIDLDAAAIDAFSTPDGDSWPLRDALGADTLDPDQIELFPVSDLTGLGLTGYMTEGLGVAEGDIAADAARLDALRGHVLVVRSAAFSGQAQTLTPRTPLRWIGTWPEDRPPVDFAPLPDASARGEALPKARKPVSDAAMSGRIATLVLLFLFALVGLMVWIAA